VAKVGTVHPAIAGTAAWQRAVREYIERLREHYRERLAAVVLYGSRARGDADEAESDVDLLVVLQGPLDEGGEHRYAWDLARGLDQKYGQLLLCPFVATQHDYQRRMLPLFMNIRREGIELWPPRDPKVREGREPYQGDATEEVALIRRHMEEALADAQDDLSGGRYNSATNRAYYAMFHAATALLLMEGMAFSRHRGVISAFGQHIVQTGRFDRELGAKLNDAFDLRNRADYSYSRPVTQEEATALVGTAAAFVAEAERLLGT
jgi:hypothetical protein